MRPPPGTEFQVSAQQAGTDLLSFLAEALDCSKRAAKARLDRRDVFVNGRRIWMARHRLAARDVVTVAGATATPARETAEALFCDPACSVYDKPAGMLSVGSGSLETRLRATQGLYAVHRLDRDTSGCMLFAGTQVAREALIEQFRVKAVTKTYLCVVNGAWRGADTIRQRLDRKAAVTHVKAIQVKPKASLLQIVIETGRTHQIRRHLASVGSPVLGERQYATGDVRRHEQSVTRQMLHAWELGFESPADGKRHRVRAPIAADFRACCARLGLRADQVR